MNSPRSMAMHWIVRVARPLLLLAGILVYALGAGVAHFLGFGVDWGAYILGQAWVITIQFATFLLIEYYHSPITLNRSTHSNPHRTPGEGDGWLSRRSILLVAFTCLTVLASLTVLIIAQTEPSPPVVFVMMVGFLSALSYSTPLVKGGSTLEASGYGELLAAFLMGFLIPAFAFALQAEVLHRLLFMTTIPLVVVCLAMFIALEITDYAVDLKSGKCTLMVRMGWKTAMNLHNILIFSAYLLVGLASLFGQPRFATMGALFSLPVGMLQFWQIWRIGQGAKPNWTALRINAIATFGFMAYMLTYSYWTH